MRNARPGSALGLAYADMTSRETGRSIMHLTRHGLALLIGLATSGVGSALAQTGGTTSGPAVNSPATLGTGGVTPATPHQTEAVRNQGGASVAGEQRGQLGGTTDTVKPGASDAGSGVTPRRQ
ncbi:MAG: hypothetical protein NVSMB18_01540 [Acetobacteraceae bacterium]